MLLSGPWPPAALSNPADAVDTAATAVSDVAGGPVQTLDDTLSVLETTLVTVNTSLVSAAAAAKDVLEGDIMTMLVDDVVPTNALIEEYALLVQLYQGTTVYVLFSLIFGFVFSIVAVVSIWMILTEVYQHLQRKAMESDHNSHTRKLTEKRSEKTEDEVSVCVLSSPPCSLGGCPPSNSQTCIHTFLSRSRVRPSVHRCASVARYKSFRSGLFTSSTFYRFF